MIVILYYDKRTEITIESLYGRLVFSPDITLLNNDFEPSKLEGVTNCVLIIPTGHYFIGRERFLALQHFKQDPSNKVIYI